MHQFIYRRHKLILLGALLLTVLSIAFALRLKLDLNLFSLLPEEKPEVKRFFQVSEKIGFQSLLISIVEMNGEIPQSQRDDFIEALAHRYGQSNLIKAVDYKNDNQALTAVFNSALAHIPLLLSFDSLKILAQRLSNEKIDQKIAENKKILMTPFSVAGKEMIVRDPLGIGELLADGMAAPGMGQRRNLPAGLYRTKDGLTYFLFLHPVQPPQDMAFSKQLLKEIAAIESAVLTEHTESIEKIQTKIRFHHTGGHPIAVQDEAITKSDIKMTLLTSLIGVLLLFFITFRTVKILVFVGLPLLLSILWTAGFAGLVFHHLNILTCIFACVLIGLGIDFAIHIVNRFYDPKTCMLPTLNRLEITFQSSGAGILVGGMTTAAAFYAVGLSDFKGFRELGCLTGTGILFSLLAMMLVLPALLTRSAAGSAREGHTIVSSFGVQYLLNPIRRYPGRVLIFTALIVCGLIYAGIGIQFDDNLKNFRPKDHTVLDLQNRVSQWLGGSLGVVLLTITDPSEKVALDLTDDIVRALEPLKEQGKISGLSAVTQLIPSPAHQQQNLNYLLENKESFDINRIRKAFDAALNAHGFRHLDQYDRYFKLLDEAFSNQSPLLPSAVDIPLLARILHRFYYHDGRQFTSVVYINPPKDLWSFDQTHRFQATIAGKLAEAGVNTRRYHLTGANLLTGELKRLILDNLKVSLAAAAGSIFLILLVYFRSLTYLFFSILPLAIGMAVLSGIMVIFGIKFNFLNIMILPMIIGIGIDDGVHFTNTFRHSGPVALAEELFQTGRAVVLTSLTTMAGFGSIIWSHYPGLKSMGYVALIGIAACLAASILILPAVFSKLRKDS